MSFAAVATVQLCDIINIIYSTQYEQLKAHRLQTVGAANWYEIMRRFKQHKR